MKEHFPSPSALAELQVDFQTLYVVELSPPISTMTLDLLMRHHLRAGDAVQLASCLYIQQLLRQSIQLVAYDARLVAAARQEALTILP